MPKEHIHPRDPLSPDALVVPQPEADEKPLIGPAHAGDWFGLWDCKGNCFVPPREEVGLPIIAFANVKCASAGRNDHYEKYPDLFAEGIEIRNLRTGVLA